MTHVLFVKISSPHPWTDLHYVPADRVTQAHIDGWRDGDWSSTKAERIVRLVNEFKTMPGYTCVDAINPSRHVKFTNPVALVSHIYMCFDQNYC